MKKIVNDELSWIYSTGSSVQRESAALPTGSESDEDIFDSLKKQHTAKNTRSQQNNSAFSTVLIILLSLCLLLLIWIGIGAMMNQGMIPELDLGYDWLRGFLKPFFETMQ